MLDIYTWIISCIVFSTWHIFSWYWHLRLMWHALSWLYDVPELTMLFLSFDLVLFLSCDLVFLWSCDYTTQQLLVQDISCSLYICHTMHARSPCTWSINSIFLLMLLLSVPDTVNHLILIISMLYLYCTAFSCFLFYCSFPLCTLVGPLLTDHYYFSVSRSESRYQ